MGFLNKMFGSDDTKNEKSLNPKIDWIELKDLGQLNEIINLSNQKAVVIFKHSTRCSVSRMALKQFENEFDLNHDIETYYLDLINYRMVSNEIATRFDVIHQSPQLLFIKNGKCIYSASHAAIDAEILKELV